MIQIKNTDTLIDILEKITSIEWRDIILNFPIWHPILHNYLSLKIIKSKSAWKKLTIITNDLISRKIGKNLWIHYSIIKDSEYIENKSMNHSELMKHNFSFSEYFIFELKKYYREIVSFIKRNKKINTIKKYSNKYKSYSNIWLFIGLFIISLLLFIFIFYFAINKTTIIITPEITVKKKAKNFIFKENIDSSILNNDEIIKIKPLIEKFSLSKTYTTTWIKDSSIKKSQWKIQISNMLWTEIKLLPKTRLLTKKWILFEIEKWTLIPPAVKDNFGNITPWTINIIVKSKNYDINSKFTGKRWNIKKWTKMSLPWLKDNWKTVFAISTEDFSWWEDTYISEVSKENIHNSKILFEQKLKNEVTKKLKNRVIEMNKNDKTNFDIISIDNIIKYSNLKIEIVDKIKEWDTAKNITLKWEIIGKTYIYDKIKILNKLKSIIQENILKWIESIFLIDEKSLRFSTIIYKKDSPVEIKATLEINTLISHDFLNKNNSYTEKLKNTIRWLPKKEAIKLLLNDPRISNVKINIRPFFIHHVSNIFENIIFKIEKN